MYFLFQILCDSSHNHSSDAFKGIEPLEKTLFHSFDNDDDHHHLENQGCPGQEHHVGENGYHDDDEVDHDNHNGDDDHENDHDNDEDHKDRHSGTMHNHKRRKRHIDVDRMVHDHEYKYHEDEPFCCMLWMKMVFMSGFTLSQFTVNNFGDKMNVLKYNIRALIISGMIASGAIHVEVFAIAYFIVAYTSTSMFLLLTSHVLESLDVHTDHWKWRLIGGICFQINWSISRLLADVIVLLSNEWNTVISVITIFIGMVLQGLRFLLQSNQFECFSHCLFHP